MNQLFYLKKSAGAVGDEYAIIYSASFFLFSVQANQMGHSLHAIQSRIFSLRKSLVILELASLDV